MEKDTRWMDKRIKVGDKSVGTAVWEDTRNVLVHLDNPPEYKTKNDLKWFQKTDCQIDS